MNIPPLLVAEVEQRLSGAGVMEEESETSLDGDDIVAEALLWFCLRQTTCTDT